MRYEEPELRLVSIIIIIFAFLVIFSPWYLNFRELLGDEGLFGIMAMDMNLLNPTSLAHGENLSFYYPLYPWIVAIFYKFGLSIELALRGTSVLALAGITFVVFEVTRRIAGLQGAFVASSFMFSNIFVLQKANDGNPFTLTVLILFMGWLFWYYFGIIKKDWNVAWIVSLFFAGLAFYTFGWMAIWYFFIPLIFMRRPLTLWNKLSFPGFTIGICLVVIFILLWIIPQLIGRITIQFNTLTVLNDISKNYFTEVLLYPFNVIGGLMPWSVIAWPAFCVAYYPLDENPIFSRFLRLIFFSLFLILWINPFTSAKDLIILVPPLAIMAGNNYWLLIRRNGFGLMKIFLILNIFLLIFDLSGLIMFLVPEYFWYTYFPFIQIKNFYFFKGIDFFKLFFTLGVIQLSIGVAIGFIFLIFHKKHIPIWIRALSLCIMFMLFFWSIPYRHGAQGQEARITAQKIIKSIGKDYNSNLTIYKGPHIADIYILSCYLNCKVNKVYSYNELPKDTKTVYVFTLTPPIFPNREWTLVKSLNYREKRLYIWKGKLLNR